MKKLLYVSLLLFVLIGCKNNNVYKDLLKQEEELIESFIKRNNITVVDEEPQEWGDNVYWKVGEYDDFYFHLVSVGDTTLDEVEAGDKISVRFREYTLVEYADTLFNWNTNDHPMPVTFLYNPHAATSEATCVGWQLAIKYMKYPKAECKIICPSKLGFTEANSSVTPYGYDLKRTDIQIKN